MGTAVPPAIGGGLVHDSEHSQNGVNNNGNGEGSESARSGSGVNTEWNGSPDSGRSRGCVDVGFKDEGGGPSSFGEESTNT